MKRLPVIALALTLSSPLAAAEQIMLVLDASGSMWGQIEGRSKVEIARDAVADLLSDWNPEHELGLIAYGHNRRGDCDDIEVLKPPGPVNASAFSATVNGLNALGMTPLSAAVIQAAEVMKVSEQKATVILISDGEENCAMDPCQVGRDLDAAGVDFRAHVIGFDVSDPQQQAQLRCLAENTGGLYFNAANAAELRGSLGAVLASTSDAELPPAEASLTAPDEAEEASRLIVGYEGPADAGDYIAVVDEQGRELSYHWVPEGQTRGELSLILPSGTGDHELIYVSAQRSRQALARRQLRLTEAAASLTAADGATQGGTVAVTVRGPFEGGQNWVGIAPINASTSTYISYRYHRASEAEYQLQVPSEPGEYEIRFVLAGAEQPLLRRPLRVSPAEILISGPEVVQVGDQVEVRAIGPKDQGHWIGIAEPGAGDGAHLAYRYLVSGQDSYSLGMPNHAGQYELRYVLANPTRVMARQLVQVIPAQVAFDAPAQVGAGERFDFRAEGPQGERHYVTIVAPGRPDGEFESWQGVNSGGRYNLAAPELPGVYELRYVLGGNVVVGRQSIQVGP